MKQSKIDPNKYDSYNSEIAVLVPPGSKVLDVGCNTGKLAQALKRKNCEVTGIDLDDKLLKIARKHCTKTVKADIEDRTKLKASLKRTNFDAIILGDVVEHLKRPGEMLVALKPYLKDNGVIICSTPNSAFIWMRVRFLLGDFSYTENGGLMDIDHLRFFSFATTRELFESCGYKVMLVKPSSHGITNWKFFFLKALARIVPSLFAIHILIVAKKS